MKKVVSLSGGKDSTALALLSIKTRAADDELIFIFCDTGNEHTLTYKYVDYLDGVLRNLAGTGITRLSADFSDKINKKRESFAAGAAKGWDEKRLYECRQMLRPSYNPFLDLCLWKGRFPSSMARFCTVELKVEPCKKFIGEILASGEDCESIVGVRADESPKRSALPETELFMKNEETGAECWVKRPILHWKASQCFDLMKEFGVEPNPLYKMGMHRVGCLPCIFCNKTELKEIAERFPAELYRIESWENQVTKTSRRGGATFFPATESNVKTIWQKVEWARTERGAKGYSLDLFEEDLACCKSIYGLCE
jgi:3'-phosphoadenosine 5'-phosphosulfate sulfotransferase (PAPS reductase)/FAD synthetase